MCFLFIENDYKKISRKEIKKKILKIYLNVLEKYSYFIYNALENIFKKTTCWPFQAIFYPFNPIFLILKIFLKFKNYISDFLNLIHCHLRNVKKINKNFWKKSWTIPLKFLKILEEHFLKILEKYLPKIISFSLKKKSLSNIEKVLIFLNFMEIFSRTHSLASWKI